MNGERDEARLALLRQMFNLAVAEARPGLNLLAKKHFSAPRPPHRLIVVGAGKAASLMAVTLGNHYAEFPFEVRVTGFVVTRHGLALPPVLIGIEEAGHPVPDEGSVRGAQRALELARSATENDLVVCLLSGGASALWCAPVAGVSLAAKQALTRDLLRAGARISEINCVRKHLSAIKGGKLAAAAYPARIETLAISDVPGDDPAVIGSGPTVSDPTSLADAVEVLARFKITPPPEITAALLDPANETLKPGAPKLANAKYSLIATPHSALEAAADGARRAGWRVEILGDALEGEAREVGAAHARLALAAHARGERVAILSGGELTVTVRGNGAGGPNQEYALALAIALGAAPGISALAADTDGIDGGGGSAADPAGAVVTESTLARAAARQLDPATFLANNNSSAFFAALGDLVACGPTQTNVNDFRAILVDPSGA